jgi:predicted transcriptional regulator of viral defense system
MPAHDKTQLAQLLRASKSGVVSVPVAARALGVSSGTAAARLMRLVRRGWLVRARRGTYFIPPLESTPGASVTAQDSWIIAAELFAPCYIGGWSAAEHWGLTEQLFRSTLVVTAARVRSGRARTLGHEFRLFSVRPARSPEGVVQVWRGSERVAVSNAERTIVDCLSVPNLCGGIRHLAQIMREYGDSGKRDAQRLAGVARAIASGAAWKRLGYLAELLWPDATELHAEALKHLSAGYTKLDPAVRQKGRLLRRWRLAVNVDVREFNAESGQTA